MITTRPLFGLAFCALLLTCCSKDNTQQERLQLSDTRATAPADEASRVFVEYLNGQYVSSYQGGITFGPNLPHPTDDPTGIYDGYPIPTIEWVNWTLNAAEIPYAIDGAYFSMLQPTFPTSGITSAEATLNAIHEYQKALDKINHEFFWNPEDRHTKLLTVPSPQITAVASGGGSVRRVSGLLIRDHESPTKMSVVQEKYATPNNTSATKQVGVVSQGIYFVSLRAPVNSTSGPVTTVAVMYNSWSGASIAVAGFNVDYEPTGAPGGYHTFGTVTLADNTVLIIDSILEP